MDEIVENLWKIIDYKCLKFVSFLSIISHVILNNLLMIHKEDGI